MKTFTIPAGILVLILAFSLWTGQYVENRINCWTALLEETDKAAQRDDWKAAADALDRAYAGWNSSQTFFHTIMEHEELDKAEDLFAGAAAMCREEQRAAFRMFLSRLAEQLDSLSETQSLGIKNIL